jgi:hypothetical protein
VVSPDRPASSNFAATTINEVIVSTLWTGVERSGGRTLIRRSSANPSRLSLGIAAGSGETARSASGQSVSGVHRPAAWRLIIPSDEVPDPGRQQCGDWND